MKIIQVKIEPCTEDLKPATLAHGSHIIGRGPLLQIVERKVGRTHATIEVTTDDVKLEATKDVYMKKNGEDSFNKIIRGTTISLSHLDQVSLIINACVFKVVYEFAEKEGEHLTDEKQLHDVNDNDDMDIDLSLNEESKLPTLTKKKLQDEKYISSFEPYNEPTLSSMAIEFDTENKEESKVNDSNPIVEVEPEEEEEEELNDDSELLEELKNKPRRVLPWGSSGTKGPRKMAKGKVAVPKATRTKRPVSESPITKTIAKARAKETAVVLSTSTSTNKEDRSSKPSSPFSKNVIPSSTTTTITTSPPTIKDNIDKPTTSPFAKGIITTTTTTTPTAKKGTLLKDATIAFTKEDKKKDLGLTKPSTLQRILREETKQGDTSQDNRQTPSGLDSPKKLKKCPFGKTCYRKNAKHFQEFDHGENDDAPSPPKYIPTQIGATTTGTSVTPVPLSAMINSATTNTASVTGTNAVRIKAAPAPAPAPVKAPVVKKKPFCEYGTKCYRKNPQHIADFDHTEPPPKQPRRACKNPKRRKKDDDESDGPNEYDLNDDFLASSSEESSSNSDDDSDYDPYGGKNAGQADDDEEEEEEDLNELLEQSKDFVTNKRMWS